MFRNYLKTAIRNLSKNKFFTILNVFGLALGMSLSLLFIALLTFLSRFDNFHPNGDRIYRVITQRFDKKENPKLASAPAGLAENLTAYPGVERVVRIQRSLSGNAIYAEKKIELYGYFAEPGFFEMFNYPLLKGNKATALNSPNSILLSESEATKIFGSKEPMGELLTIEGYGSFLITGIFKDLPENTHMQFGALASYATLLSYNKSFLPGSRGEWNAYTGSFVYLQLSNETEPGNIGRFLDKVAKERYAPENTKAEFELQALNKITPGPELWDPIGPNWSYLMLLITGSITLIVLIPACANYVNLSISQSLERMKEIGVRKVMGGRKQQIVMQFIVESTTIVLIALLLSYVIYELIRKDFLGGMVETSPMDLSPTWETFFGFLLFALLVGVLAGIVPGLYFSRLTPSIALKGKEVKTSGRSLFRKIVLAVQFIISLGFIMAVVIMMRQYYYSVNYDLGFEQESVLDVDLQNVDPQIFKNEFSKLPVVKRISMSSHVLGVGSAAERYMKTADQFDSIAVSSMSVDEAFISNMKLHLLAGRDFNQNTLENTRFIIVNEEFVKSLKLEAPAQAINKIVTLTNGSEFRIAGVLKNFHFAGLKEAIAPFFFEHNPGRFAYANMKLASSADMSSISAMEQLWKKIGGAGKFNAQLFAAKIKEAYNFYIMITKLWGFLGILAITVACLGLLGTVSFTIKKRVKEIGIRKVLGATAKSLVVLLSKDFVMLMVIASVITIPIIYFLFTNLLNNTQYYSIQIGFLEIFASLLIMMLLGLTTILSQTLKAANANPVDNLKTE
ncbi:ABC transporter permease [Segetibacter sp. 3557_3]|uniref:ABC transporter permease n=1 Tax=Segetibacter sp. 3557_3 TaxID=2547429 RepID=UPI001058FE5B|nr:ABC transporter permease [Segetibacter sp. 3557_3]TDH24619.1 ABC transporter permease [Segetibacter sp. 3557_3]